MNLLMSEDLPTLASPTRTTLQSWRASARRWRTLPIVRIIFFVFSVQFRRFRFRQTATTGSLWWYLFWTKWRTTTSALWDYLFGTELTVSEHCCLLLLLLLLEGELLLKPDRARHPLPLTLPSPFARFSIDRRASLKRRDDENDADTRSLLNCVQVIIRQISILFSPLHTFEFVQTLLKCGQTLASFCLLIFVLFTIQCQKKYYFICIGWKRIAQISVLRWDSKLGLYDVGLRLIHWTRYGSLKHDLIM